MNSPKQVRVAGKAASNELHAGVAALGKTPIGLPEKVRFDLR